MQPQFLLRGVAGSTAHGLARPGSDEDLHGVYGWPTEAYWHFAKPEATITGHEPQDYSYHELEKFLKLALANNPTILELLYLDSYVEKDTWGNQLIENRHRFLHTKGVRDSYLGYARSQFHKIENREDNTFSSDTRNRTAKHARHLFRLLEQAQYLLETGSLKVRVDNPQWYFQMEEMPVSEWQRMYEGISDYVQNIESVLPDEPDHDWVDDFLFHYRKAH